LNSEFKIEALLEEPGDELIEEQNFKAGEIHETSWGSPRRRDNDADYISAKICMPKPGSQASRGEIPRFDF
jgi:hypothetical protein